VSGRDGIRARRIDAAGIITTIAGSGPAGVDKGSFSGDGGPATEATLQEPWGIAFDHAGNLDIGDRDNYRVRQVDPTGMIDTVAGTGDEHVMCPHGVAIDPGGNLVIADPCNHRILRLDGHGKISTIAGTGKQGFSGDGGKAPAADVDAPEFPTFDKTGAMVFVSGPRIRRIDPAGVITTIAGTGKFGAPIDGMPALDLPFNELYGLAVDAAGNVYVADGSTFVYKVDVKGILTIFAGKSSERALASPRPARHASGESTDERIGVPASNPVLLGATSLDPGPSQSSDE
jgi:DNA-binding beta-propeller fold protein YncE